jgi:hypothetical protein
MVSTVYPPLGILNHDVQDVRWVVSLAARQLFQIVQAHLVFFFRFLVRFWIFVDVLVDIPIALALMTFDEVFGGYQCEAEGATNLQALVYQGLV